MKKHWSLVDLVKLDEVLLGFIIVFFLLWHILKIFHNKKLTNKHTQNKLIYKSSSPERNILLIYDKC